MKKGSTNNKYKKNRRPRPLKNDFTGRRFGNLVVVKRMLSYRDGSVLWECICDCGNTTSVSTRHLNRKNNTIRSCGCLIKRRGQQNPLWDGYGDMSASWFYNHILRETKQLKRPKVPVTVTKQYLWELFVQQRKCCALSGLPLVLINGNGNTASVDRIDNSGGYVPGNVQWVHKDVNMMKRNYSDEYFRELCGLISSHGK